MEHTNTGPVSAEEFRAWAAVPGVMLVVGSREEVIRWSNTAFAESFGFSVEEMDGKRYDSYLPEAVLVERRQIWKPMLDRGERVEYSQLIHDRRMRTLTAPLDPEVMGPDAIVFGFFPEGELNSTPNMPIAAHSVLHEFAVLSPAELRVLHAFAQGWSRDEIAQRLFRSPHTVQVHLKNIYAKLGIHREVELALKLGRSGLGSFSIVEWERIVQSTTHMDARAQPSEPGHTLQ